MLKLLPRNAIHSAQYYHKTCYPSVRPSVTYTSLSCQNGHTCQRCHQTTHT